MPPRRSTLQERLDAVRAALWSAVLQLDTLRAEGVTGAETLASAGHALQEKTEALANSLDKVSRAN